MLRNSDKLNSPEIWLLHYIGPCFPHLPSIFLSLQVVKMHQRALRAPEKQHGVQYRGVYSEYGTRTNSRERRQKKKLCHEKGSGQDQWDLKPDFIWSTAFSGGLDVQHLTNKDPAAQLLIVPRVTIFSKTPCLCTTFLATEWNQLCFNPEKKTDYASEKSLYKELYEGIYFDLEGQGCKRSKGWHLSRTGIALLQTRPS